MILLDSNILIDIIEKDPVWFGWSFDKLVELGQSQKTVINHIVLAETAPFSGPLEQFIQSLDTMGIEVQPLCNQSAFAGGLAFLEYRKRRKLRRSGSILPDFLIGGHAKVLGATILTRDTRFYRSYFPSVPLIAPAKDEND